MKKAGAVQSPEAPDITVIVSCTITAAADRKCRKLIRKMRRENPDSLIIACGCYAQRMPDSDRAALGVDILIGNRMKHKVAELAADWFTKRENRDHLFLFLMTT